MEDNILEMDLNEEQEKMLRETLENFKEEVYANLLEEVEELKEKKIEELEEANEEWRKGVKKEYTDKMLDALGEMREEVKAEVVSEMVESNPELQVLEKIKETIAPTLDESYVENAYADELVTLRNRVEELEEEKKVEEGAKTLADLISPYSEETQNILLSVIKEGGPEEVTEQFYEIIENLESVNETDDKDDDEEEDDDDEEGAYDDEGNYVGKARPADDEEEEDDEEEDDEDEEEDEEEEEEADEDFSEFDSYIQERKEGETKKTSKGRNPLLSRISELSN